MFGPCYCWSLCLYWAICSYVSSDLASEQSAFAISQSLAIVDNSSSSILYLPPYAGVLGNQPRKASNFVPSIGNDKVENVTSTKVRLRLVTVKEPPFVTYQNVYNGTLIFGHNNTGPGVVIEILEELRKRLNAEFEYMEADGSHWGEEIEQGIWSGMLGMVQRKEVDIVAAASVVRFDRLKVAEMSYPFHVSETGMLIRAPSRFLENRFLIVTAPFETRVWLLSVLAIFVSGCVMKALGRALKRATEVQYGWIEAVWMFFSVFVQQGLPMQPKSWTCRTMLAFWWLSALTLAATFTGNMVALFAVNKSTFPFTTREELLQHIMYKGYKIVTPNKTDTWIRFLQASQLNVFKQLWREMTVKKKWINVTNLDEGVKLVKTQPHLVLLGPRETLDVYAASDCAVAVPQNGIIPLMYTIMLQKHSPYEPILSNLTRELVESGIIFKWMHDYHFHLAAARGDFCVFYEGATAAGEAVDVVRAQGAFWVLLTGAILGMGSILFEVIIQWLRLDTMAAKTLAACKIVTLINFVTRRRGKMEMRYEDATRINDPSVRATYANGNVFEPETCNRTTMTESARAYQPNTNASNNTLKCRRKFTDQRV